MLQIGQSLFGVGQAALAGIVALNSDWRALSTIMAMPMLMAIFIWFFNDESARWLISRNRIDEANQILRKIAKVNGREVKNKYVFEESKDDEESDTPAESLTNAIKLPRMRGMILNLCYQVTDHSPFTGVFKVLFFNQILVVYVVWYLLCACSQGRYIWNQSLYQLHDFRILGSSCMLWYPSHVPIFR